jgi:hypothetical protein
MFLTLPQLNLRHQRKLANSRLRLQMETLDLRLISTVFEIPVSTTVLLAIYRWASI